MQVKKLGIIAMASVLCCFQSTHAEEEAKGFVNCVHKDADGNEAKYVLFVPHGYKGEKDWPVILFLHGSGETGTDGLKQARVGLGPAIRKQETTFPFFAVFPQSQKRTWRAGSSDADRALAVLAEMQKKYKIDPKRVYLTGLSMGGFGTWSLATAHPEKWAAIVPICGGGDPRQAEKLKDLPCWCFHGTVDRAVRVDFSRRMIEAIKEAGGEPKYTEYEGVGHNSWDRAYGTEALYPWLLEHKTK